MKRQQHELKWRNFKINPPYDAYEDDQNGLETDFVSAWFVYRFKNRPHIKEKNNKFISHTACHYSQGVFEKYESSMGSSPYKYDHIEVLYWIEDIDVRKLLMLSFGESEQ